MFPENLVYFRKRDGLNQTELAKKLGVSRSTISMWETGEREPNFEMLEAIADVFNVNMSTLLGEEIKLPAEVESFPEFNMIARAGAKMSPERRADMIKMLRIAFPEAFEDE